MGTTYDTTQYEIRYSTATKMYEVLYRGERIDWMLPSYADGEASIQLHASVKRASVKRANDEAWAWAFANAPVACVACADEAGMQRAAETVYRRYPNAVFGRWSDYVTALALQHEPTTLTAAYAVIALPDGYAVHYVLPSGSLGAHIETLRWHDEEAQVVAVRAFELAA